uniref:Uncharacterized protein n=1 Tax=Panagrolaimus sp. PS1159 TaxID=55785 RepID=A0AC35FV75_9BILA
MKLEKRQTTTLNLKPCSMTSFSHLNEIYYGIACYEQNSQNEYIGEIIITKSSDLSEIKKIPTNGGVFRIYSLPKENSIFAVTTSGDFIFINDESYNVKVISNPDKPYFTDGSVSTNYLAATDDKGYLHLIDRQTQLPIMKVRAHRLRKVGDLECPAWSCTWINDCSLVSVGDDGRCCIWDLRESNLKESLFIQGLTDDGMVFVSSKQDNIISVGDYAQNYCLYDLRSTTKMPIITKEYLKLFIIVLIVDF